MNKYRKGDIIGMRFPFSDLTSSKYRPALIISNEFTNQGNDYLMVQITSVFRDNNPYLIEISQDDVTLNPLPKNSCVKIFKVYTLNESLIRGKITAVSEEFSTKIKSAFIDLL